MENEKWLIDLDSVIEQLEIEWGYDGMREDLYKLPTVDAVEVVRCKDCKHLEITGCYGECNRGYMGIVKPWDFCSYGERREGE